MNLKRGFLIGLAQAPALLWIALQKLTHHNGANRVEECNNGAGLNVPKYPGV